MCVVCVKGECEACKVVYMYFDVSSVLPGVFVCVCEDVKKLLYMLATECYIQTHERDGVFSHYSYTTLAL